MSKALTLQEYVELTQYIARHHSPLMTAAKKPIIKYMNSCADFRTNTIFSVTLRGHGGCDRTFHNTNEYCDHPQSLKERIMDYLNAKEDHHQEQCG